MVDARRLRVVAFGREPRRGTILTRLAAQLRSLGPYFVIDEHRPANRATTWWSMAELVTQPEVLRQQIAAVRTILAARAGVPADVLEWRVAASTAHFGLTARLLAPALGVTVLTGSAPDWQLAELHWQRTLAGPFPLAVAEPDPPPHSRAASDLAGWITDGPIGRLTDAVCGCGPMSRQVVQGNVASALHSAAQQIGAARGDLGGAAAAVVAVVTREQPFPVAGGMLPSGRFRRRSCCLIYRAARPVPRGADRIVCDDCVLAH